MIKVILFFLIISIIVYFASFLFFKKINSIKRLIISIAVPLLLWASFYVYMCLLFINLIGGCSDDNSYEPDDIIIQQSIQQHFESFNELLKIFREDVAEANVSFVSVKSSSLTQCELNPQRHPCFMQEERWKEYQKRLKQLGVLSISHTEPGDRYYFVTYYKSWLMDARIRGVVFSEAKVPNVSGYATKEHWKPIQNGWYSFLKVDN